MDNREGKQFEVDWKTSFEHNDIYIQRMKDNPLAWMNKDKNMKQAMYAQDNPYDFFAFLGGHLLCMELKSTNKPFISFDRKKGANKMIKYHQIEGLMEARKHKGVFAGLVMEFRAEKVAYYLDIARFYVFLKTTDKVSINISDIKRLGGIEIPRELLISHYRYDVVDMFQNIVNDPNVKIDKAVN